MKKKKNETRIVDFKVLLYNTCEHLCCPSTQLLFCFSDK